MNIGNIVTSGLRKADLSVKDFSFRSLGIDFLNEIIQEHWEYQNFGFKKGTFYLQTAQNIEEYSLSKYCAGVKSILNGTMRGSDPIRRISFKPSTEFLKTHPYELSSGDPYIFWDGEYRGFQTQVSASSLIKFQSSLANISTGTVNVTYGSNRVVFSSGVITIDVLGRWFRVGTDQRRYQIIKMESSTVAILDAPYEGTNNSTASYVIGDVQQKGIVLGYLNNGSLYEEEVQLNGATSVSTVNFYQMVVRISKSDKTGGYVTATSNNGLITNITLDPGETEADFQSVKLYPIPTKGEAISYEAGSKHPYLYKNTDSPLLPSQWHPLLALDLYIKLQTEWNKKEVSSETLRRRDQMFQNLIANDNNTDNWTILQDSDQTEFRSNLPNNYPYTDDYSF